MTRALVILLLCFLPGEARAITVGGGASTLQGNVKTICASGGSGSFVPGPMPNFSGPTDYAITPGAEDVEVGDLNNDGHLDIVATGGGIAGFDYRLGVGDGTFGALANVSTGFGATPNARAVAVADYDKDGNLDVAVIHDCATGGDEKLYVALGTGSGFGSATGYANTANSCPRGVAAGDLNKDGYPDIVVGQTGTGGVGNENRKYIGVFLNDGDGTFAAEVRYETGCYGHVSFDCDAQGREPRGTILLDFDKDGNIDVVTADVGGDDFTFFRGNGDGTLQIGTPIRPAASTSARNIAAGDLDCDGYIDLLGGGQSNRGPVLENMTDRGGTSDSTTGTASGADGTATLTFSAGVNLLTANVQRGWIFKWSTDDRWYTVKTITSKTGITLASALIGTHTNEAYTLRNGIFMVPPSEFTGGAFSSNAPRYLHSISDPATSHLPVDVALADLNNDGLLDGVAAAQEETGSGISTLLVATGDGRLGFNARRTFSAGATPQLETVATGDFNEDGWTDIVAGGRYSAKLHVFLNTTDSKNQVLFGRVDNQHGADFVAQDINDVLLSLRSRVAGACFVQAYNAAEFTCQGIASFTVFDGAGGGGPTVPTAFLADGRDYIQYPSTALVGDYGGFATPVMSHSTSDTSFSALIHTGATTLTDKVIWAGIGTGTTLGAVAPLATQAAVASRPAAIGYDSAHNAFFNCCTGNATETTCQQIGWGTDFQVATNTAYILQVNNIGGGITECCVTNISATPVRRQCHPKVTTSRASVGAQLMGIVSVRTKAAAAADLNVSRVAMGRK